MLFQTMILICVQNFQSKQKEAVVSTKMLDFLSFIRSEENREKERKEGEVVE